MAIGDDAPDECAPGAELREFTAAEEHHAQRLDKVMAQMLPEFSRSFLQQLLQEGSVMVDGQAASKNSVRVWAGARIAVTLRPTLQSQAFRPQPMPLEVVFEDEHLLVIDKPAGLVVHPAPGHWSGTLLNGLLARDAGAALLPRAGIVHRLDRDTSGLMVVARTRQAMEALVRMMAARQVSRRYLALAHRAWTGAATLRVAQPIGRDPHHRLRMAVVDMERHSGKAAMTDVECLDSAGQFCLLRCTLHTGRTHQIRVHLAAHGHPLLGDALYGGAPAAGMQRQALHAYRLAFGHPLGGQPLAFHSPLPQDMAQALQHLGLRYNAGADDDLSSAPVQP